MCILFYIQKVRLFLGHTVYVLKVRDHFFLAAVVSASVKKLMAGRVQRSENPTHKSPRIESSILQTEMLCWRSSQLRTLAENVQHHCDFLRQ